MKLKELFSEQRPTLSFEAFPPKTGGDYDGIARTVGEIAALGPAFMSVTYGAVGNTAAYSVKLAKSIAEHSVTPLAHLTCVASTKDTVHEQLRQLREAGIENVLALRGDVPEGMEPNAGWPYHHASELVRDIRDFGGFCVGGACYPEGHPESETRDQDIANLRKKADAGCDFLTSQMFFDNNIFYNFLYRAREEGIKVPIVAGIMPVTNAKQIRRICALSGTELPQRFRRIVDKYAERPAAMKQAGIAYATEQIIDLFANGVKNVHVYSMNKPDVATKIWDNLSEILK